MWSESQEPQPSYDSPLTMRRHSFSEYSGVIVEYLGCLKLLIGTSTGRGEALLSPAFAPTSQTDCINTFANTR